MSCSRRADGREGSEPHHDPIRMPLLHRLPHLPSPPRPSHHTILPQRRFPETRPWSDSPRPEKESGCNISNSQYTQEPSFKNMIIMNSNPPSSGAEIESSHVLHITLSSSSRRCLHKLRAASTPSGTQDFLHNLVKFVSSFFVDLHFILHFSATRTS